MLQWLPRWGRNIVDRRKDARLIYTRSFEVSSWFFKRTCGSVGLLVVVTGSACCSWEKPPYVVWYSPSEVGAATLGGATGVVCSNVLRDCSIFCSYFSSLIWGGQQLIWQVLCPPSQHVGWVWIGGGYNVRGIDQRIRMCNKRLFWGCKTCSIGNDWKRGRNNMCWCHGAPMSCVCLGQDRWLILCEGEHHGIFIPVILFPVQGMIDRFVGIFLWRSDKVEGDARLFGERVPQLDGPVGVGGC